MSLHETFIFNIVELIASLTTVIVLGFLVYQVFLVKKEQQQTEKIMQYENSPFLVPYMVREFQEDSKGIKKRTGSRYLHIKNIGRGSATRVHFKIKLTKSNFPVDKNIFRMDEALATFAYDSPSFNTKIPLEDGNVEFIFKSKYFDVLGKCYYVYEEYSFNLDKHTIELNNKNNLREIFDSEDQFLTKFPDFT